MTARSGSFRRTAQGLVSLALALLGVLLSPNALAAPEPPASSAAPAPSANDAESGPSPWQAGPASLELDHGIKLELSAAYRFLPKEPAKKVLEGNGNYHNENLLGLAASADGTHDWFAVLTYDEEGYIKDDEKIDADELLSGMRDGVKELNEERQKHGFKPLTVDGWSDPPRYDRSQHELVWALVVSDADGKSVNYNTRVLGRRGYVSLDLLSSPERIAAEKTNAAALLAATSFKPGSRYEDFNKKTDKVAEYGLMGLILGGAGIAAVTKVGILAKLGGLLLAAKKLIIGFFVLIGAGLKKLFGRKSAGVPDQKETKLPPTGTDGNS